MVKQPSRFQVLISVCTFFVTLTVYGDAAHNKRIDAAETAPKLSSRRVVLHAGRNEAPVAGGVDNAYRQCDYYSRDNQTRYEDYAYQNPELPVSDVVWHVNAGLDRDFYTNCVQISSNEPFLINKFNQLPEHYVPELVELQFGHMVTAETKDAFMQLRSDAAAQGYAIDIKSGYRSFSRQQWLYQNDVDAFSGDYADLHTARAGFCEHQSGRAIDISVLFIEGGESLDEEEIYRWVAGHCAEYGFIVRYTNETPHITGYMAKPWHITYVGQEIAQYMKQMGIESLEEYVAKNPD